MILEGGREKEKIGILEGGEGLSTYRCNFPSNVNVKR